MLYFICGVPSNKPLDFFFYELVYPLYRCAQERGIDCSLIAGDRIDSDGDDDLYIGLFHHVRQMPKRYVMWNLEPDVNLSASYAYKLRKALLVLHYNPSTVREIERFSANVIPFPYYYHPSIEHLHPVGQPGEEGVDVFFYGYLDNRRREIISDIQKSGINIYVPQLEGRNVYGRERDQIIARSKIVLLLNCYDNDPDSIRATYLASKRVFFIVEEFGNSGLRDMYGNHLVIVDRGCLVETIRLYLSDPSLRAKVTTEIYQFVTKEFNLNDHFEKCQNLNI
jgi:hypothetical protein